MSKDSSVELLTYYLAPIASLFELDDLSEISVNRWDAVFIKQRGEWKRADVSFESDDALQLLIRQIGNALGQPVDEDTHPRLDGRLHDGSRVCALLPTVAPRGAALSIRVFPKNAITADQLVDWGVLTAGMLEYLRLCVHTRANVLLSGATDSGKTTFINVLARFIPKDERVITIEDTAELKIDLPNLLSLEAPRRRDEAAQDSLVVDMPFLIETSLRLNPDRIIVGEIRNAQAASAFLQAINTGATGTFCTIHANDPTDALYRLQALVSGAGDLPYPVIYDQVRRNLQVVCQLRLEPGHGRRLIELAELRDQEPVTLWRYHPATKKHVADKAQIAASSVVQTARDYGLTFSTLA